LLQFEANAGRLQGTSVPVYEDGFIFPTRVSFQKSLQQFDSLGPEWTESLLSTLTEQSNVERRFPADTLGSQVQRFLNAGAGIVKNRQQGVITLAFDLRSIRLGENRADLLLV